MSKGVLLKLYTNNLLLYKVITEFIILQTFKSTNCS